VDQLVMASKRDSNMMGHHCFGTLFMLRRFVSLQSLYPQCDVVSMNIGEIDYHMHVIDIGRTC
jgi:hypothetical protein